MFFLPLFTYLYANSAAFFAESEEELQIVVNEFDGGGRGGAL